ncbi:DUF4192 domain-containing protein [uncultured Phycicoccus sp.]|uniref:DUF4192 domain-containing protein n=1 Tax=uncultured Phycicoccus sp. TaxID=661422 RepID=UPI0026229049|nr:DUF4192 domain-containing protein [uncultured Phycicoccus sp.]
MTTSISLRDCGDVLAVLPYQLGYHPRRSVVLVALHGRRFGLIARVDLPPGPEVPRRMVDAVVGPLRREGAERVIAVGFEDEPDECVPLLLALVEELESHGADVVEVAVVRDGRRYSPTCAEPCCPPGGVPVPSADEVPGVAEFVALGVAPLPDRAALDALVAADPASGPGPDPRGPGGPTGPAGARSGRRAAARAWATVLGPRPGDRRVVPDPPGLPGRPGPMALAAASLADIPFRDALIAWLVPGLLERDTLDPTVLALLDRRLPRWAGMGRWPAGNSDPGERRHLVEVLLGLCRAVPDTRPDDAAAVCTVAAQVAWSDGDGALARSALDRALRLAPGYRLAGLLDQVVSRGVRPSTVAPPGSWGRAG